MNISSYHHTASEKREAKKRSWETGEAGREGGGRCYHRVMPWGGVVVLPSCCTRERGRERASKRTEREKERGRERERERERAREKERKRGRETVRVHANGTLNKLDPWTCIEIIYVYNPFVFYTSTRNIQIQIYLIHFDSIHVHEIFKYVLIQ